MVAPRYQEFSAERIPEVVPAAGVRVKVIAGAVGDIHGPVQQPATDPVYLDISLAAGARFEHAIAPGHNVFAYVYEGEVGIVEGTAGEGGLASGEAPAGNAKVAIGGSSAGKGELLLFGAGDAVGVEGRAAHSRLILVAGRPLGEPVARHGPFVMNTHAEIVQAVQDFQAGRF